MTGDIAQMGAYIGAGLATIGMGGAAIGVGLIVGKFLKASTAVKEANKQQGNMFVGIAFAEALGIFAFLVALLLMFAV
jgi:F-type H+-transporting ATPase subunit c